MSCAFWVARPTSNPFRARKRHEMRAGASKYMHTKYKRFIPRAQIGGVNLHVQLRALSDSRSNLFMLGRLP